ncbi:hypothetical protein Chor_015664 [Crotalus horridus]
MKPDGKVVLLGDMNVGKTSLLHRYMERRFQDTVSTVGGAFYLKQWGPHNISIWDTAGERRRGPRRRVFLFLALTDSASPDCLFVIAGNKVDLTDACASLTESEDKHQFEKPSNISISTKVKKQIHMNDAVAFYRKILKYKMLDESLSDMEEIDPQDFLKCEVFKWI